ncbi:unnamed protein product [Knipowitschia caucasica]|uniref:C-CAP/cofactor C-like domain-containing protein n=1 Tax=Knipowitschia caucasica TaxID=637954 RepID=A0AAV2LGJ3_KNICA
MAAVEDRENSFTDENNCSTVQERLSKRHQARQEEAERRKEERDRGSLTEEKRDYFITEFSREKAAIEALLSAQELEQAASQTALLQKFLNDSILFLPSYDLRQAQAALQKLHTAINDARGEARPKKKFAFKARTKATDVKDVTHANADATHANADVTDAVHERIETEQCTFSNLSGVTVTITAQEVSQRDVLLSHLEDCRVRLQGAPSSLHLKHLQRCELLCGPVSSSVFVDHCEQSVLVLACQQLRTHNTKDTQVYLHVTSRAIIEDCSGVSVAPFTWSYSGLDQDWTVSGLDRNRNNWNHVDDFNWLSTTEASPNWTVIPEEERRSEWE